MKEQTHNIYKILGVSFLLGVGAFAGVYFGYSVTSPEVEGPAILSDDQLPVTEESLRAKFERGERFPEIRLVDSTERVQLLSRDSFQSDIILIFSSMLCDACEPALTQWNQHVQPKLRPDAEVFICLPIGESYFTDEELNLFEGKRLLFYEQEKLLHELNLGFLPTYVFLDRDGFIFDVQYGYSRYYARRMIDRYCR